MATSKHSPGGALRLLAVYCEVEQNGDTGPTASQSACNGDDNHWADIYEEEIVHPY